MDESVDKTPVFLWNPRLVAIVIGGMLSRYERKMIRNGFRRDQAEKLRWANFTLAADVAADGMAHIGL